MTETRNYQSETGNHQRGLRDLVREILDELKDFANTRFQVMKFELQETLASVKVAVPLIAVALVLMFTAILVFTAAAVTLVARAFAGSPWAWFLALVIVAVLWMGLGAIAAFFAYNEFRSKGRFPKRTVEVLKADREWLQSEAHNLQGARP
jgi:uncharacterized membrane protein YqjE